MITDVYLVYNDDSQLKRLNDSLEVSLFFTYINESSRKGKKEAYKLKSEWGARKTPFAICFNKETPIKAFFSETGEDVIESLITYLNGIQKT